MTVEESGRSRCTSTVTKDTRPQENTLVCERVETFGVEVVRARVVVCDGLAWNEPFGVILELVEVQKRSWVWSFILRWIRCCRRRRFLDGWKGLGIDLPEVGAGGKVIFQCARWVNCEAERSTKQCSNEDFYRIEGQTNRDRILKWHLDRPIERSF